VVLWTRSGGAVAWALRLPGLLLVSFLLLQGTLYWHLKLRSVRDRTALPGWFCPVFRALRASSVAGIALAAAGAGVLWRAGVGGPADLGWAAGLLGFAGLEHVNYYHRQLMHDTAADWRYLRRHRRLRRAPLAVDLDRSCAALLP
jgi:hypothetical protein